MNSLSLCLGTRRKKKEVEILPSFFNFIIIYYAFCSREKFRFVLFCVVRSSTNHQKRTRRESCVQEKIRLFCAKKEKKGKKKNFILPTRIRARAF
tara:strand:- start:179 stop:463 length:285 start_codon:yes stop_codon:yes gene_type:complete